MLKNLPQVTKNLLLLNVTLYIVCQVLESQGTPVFDKLGSYYFNSPNFQPYQIISHMFMHSKFDLMHIFFNMLLLIMFGGHLERVWGAKRFFIFYFACGFGALLLYNAIGIYQISEMRSTIQNLGYNISDLDYNLVHNINFSFDSAHLSVLQKYANLISTPMMGASGALFGVLAGFAMLFPNTELMLMFIPVPIKAKYLIGGYLVYEVFNSISQPQDQIAHLAHVGGAIIGITLILVWRKTDRKNFW